MSEANYGFSDYSIFDDAVNTTNTLNKSISDINNVFTKAQAKLSDSSIFEGPICDSCVDGLNKVSSKITSMSNNYSNFSQFLSEVKVRYKSSDKNASSTYQLRETSTSSTLSGKVNLDGNTINCSKPVEKGNKYGLSDEDLAYLANVAIHEQGSLDGARMELSLMANLYEQNKGKYSNVKDYVTNSGWFASNSLNDYSYPGDDYVSAARDVLNDGNLYVPSNVNEHDCLSDIVSISTGDVYNKDDYIPGETVITNTYGAVYTFVGFAPNGGDPFGYK